MNHSMMFVLDVLISLPSSLNRRKKKEVGRREGHHNAIRHRSQVISKYFVLVTFYTHLPRFQEHDFYPFDKSLILTTYKKINSPLPYCPILLVWDSPCSIIKKNIIF